MKFLTAQPANDNADKSIEQLEDELRQIRELRQEIERSMKNENLRSVKLA